MEAEGGFCVGFPEFLWGEELKTGSNGEGEGERLTVVLSERLRDEVR